MTGPRILVVGEAMVEFVREGAGEIAEPGCFRGPFPSGAPAIVADAAALAGADVRLVSTVGADPFGALVLARLRHDGVDVRRVRPVDGATTGSAFVAYRPDGSRSFVFNVEEAAPGRIEESDLAAEPESADVLHVSGSSLALSSAMARVVTSAADRVQAAGGRLSLDVNLRAEGPSASDATRAIADLITRASFVIAAADEAAEVSEALAVARSRGAVVCVTAGARGASVSFEGAEHEVEGLPADEVDPTGAGDTFAGVFITALAQGEHPARAAARANEAGAAHVSALGPMERLGWP